MNPSSSVSLGAFPRTWLLVSAILATPGCELAVRLDPSLADAGVTDACPICADVPADADYDAADVSIYGLHPDADESSDAGDTGSRDAGDATDADGGDDASHKPADATVRD